MRKENEIKFLVDDSLLSAEWHYEKNLPLKKAEIRIQSSRNVWWKCKNGHEWQARVADRMRGNNCPFCAGKRAVSGINDLVTLNPKVATEWNYEKNGENRPEQYCLHSSKRVWWKCLKGHEWQATIDSRTRKNGNGCPYCAGQRVISGKNDLLTVAPEIAEQWSYEKNGDLRPENICVNSSKKVWWKCVYGHEWCVSPNSRYTQKTGCPKCSSELRTSFPEQAVFYYLRKLYNGIHNRYKLENGMELDIFIEEINTGIEYDGILYHTSNQAVERDDRKNKFCHEKGIRLIRVKEVNEVPEEREKDCIYRLIGRGNDDLRKVIKSLLLLINCNDEIAIGDSDIDIEKDYYQILSQYMSVNKTKNVSENIIEEWDYEKNEDIHPSMVYKSSHKKFWWKCEKGHSWQATMQHRTSKMATGCPFCSNQKVLAGYNDLQTIYPKLVEQWAWDLNERNPIEYTSKSSYKVWWKCDKGHVWEAAINKRVYGRGCPICTGKQVLVGYNDLQSLYPKLVAEWDYEKNVGISPKDVTKGSNRIVWWKCGNGHSWQETINRRVARNTKCPYCRKLKGK